MQINNPSAMEASTAQAQSNVGLLTESTIYTTNIAGKAFTADLSLSAGQYVATIPDHVPPINASGSSLVQAENDLNARISLLV
jgi:hypothetical protein